MITAMSPSTMTPPGWVRSWNRWMILPSRSTAEPRTSSATTMSPLAAAAASCGSAGDRPSRRDALVQVDLHGFVGLFAGFDLFGACRQSLLCRCRTLPGNGTLPRTPQRLRIKDQQPIRLANRHREGVR